MQDSVLTVGFLAIGFQMCPKETCDAPGTAEHTGPVTVVAPVRFDNRPTFRQPYPNNNQEPVK